MTRKLGPLLMKNGLKVISTDYRLLLNNYLQEIYGWRRGNALTWVRTSRGSKSEEVWEVIALSLYFTSMRAHEWHSP